MLDDLRLLFNNIPLMSALAAMVTAQVFKVLIEYWRTHSWRTSLLTSTGGMPSSHSALVTAMATAVGIQTGFGSTLFAIAIVLALVVMHDAAGVRRAAGKQAQAINFLFSKLESQGVKLDKKLKELLGHSPVEVAAGGVLGIIVAVIVNAIR